MVLERLLAKIGRFEIISELGQGAMGTVYRARDSVLDRLVALKTVNPALLSRGDTLARFQREARAAARLQHPNIVTIYDLGEADGVVYIAMELLEGMDLAQAMSPAGRLPLDQRIRIGVDICRGLDFAHKRGVVHRDVKPANIRILEDGGVRLVDFGIARLEDSQMTQTGLILGTPSYLAPEVLAGRRVDHRADMWATGVVLYELFSGKLPYEGDTIAGLVYRIVHEPHPPLDPRVLGFAPAIAATIDRALLKDPDARFRDMAEMGATLQEAAGLTLGAETPLFGDARETAYKTASADARRLLAEDNLESALEAARRARALEPSRPSIVALVDQIEQLFQEAPTQVTKPAPRVEGSHKTGTSLAKESLTDPRRTTAVILASLHAKGAAAFREASTFGEPPGTRCASLSPVRDLFATSGTDGAIRIWDLASQTRVATLRTELHRRNGHDGVALAVAFSADGSLLASGHVDGTVHLWDLGSGQELPARLRHEASVAALCFTPDGKSLASGGLDSNLKIWDVEAARAGEARRELVRQPSGVTSIGYLKGATWLVTGHANKVIRVVDSSNYRLLATVRGPEAPVHLLCPLPDGRHLVAASGDRTIRLFDMESRTQLWLGEAQRKPATALSFFADGRHFATVSQDNSVQLWNLDSNALVAALWGPADESFAGLALFEGGSRIAVALSDGRIRLWSPSA
jgi:serine/threonine protein kinase